MDTGRGDGEETKCQAAYLVGLHDDERSEEACRCQSRVRSVQLGRV